jgi:archaellin
MGKHKKEEVEMEENTTFEQEMQANENVSTEVTTEMGAAGVLEEKKEEEKK